MTPQEIARMEQIAQDFESLRADATIPYDVEQAFRKRLNISSFTPTLVSVKGATTENQSVNESGVASYSVLKAPDGFLQVTIANIVYYMPYYS